MIKLYKTPTPSVWIEEPGKTGFPIFRPMGRTYAYEIGSGTQRYLTMLVGPNLPTVLDILGPPDRNYDVVYFNSHYQGYFRVFSEQHSYYFGTEDAWNHLKYELEQVPHKHTKQIGSDIGLDEKGNVWLFWGKDD